MKAFFLPLLAAWSALSLASISYGQDRRFTFDGSGNLESDFPASVSPPEIVSSPQSQVVQPGELASFFVVVADLRNLTFQWRFNGTNISGATDTLSLTNVSTANQGLYSVVLSNSSGSVTSAPAMLWLDGDGDRLPDSWEQIYFGGVAQNPGGDFDGDGISNLNEFGDGTNPTNSASALFRLTIMNDGGQVSVSPTRLSYTNGEAVTVTATGFPSEVFYGWTGAVASRTNTTLNLVMTNSMTLFAHFQPFQITWITNASGNWTNPANWTPALVPTILDDVLISSAQTITISEPAECHDLIFNGGTLTGAGTLTIHGQSVWSSGAIGGAGRMVVAPGATLEIANAATVTLDTRILENAGTTLRTGAGLLLLANSTVITNRPGALFEARSSAGFSVSGVGAKSFDNAGTFRKTLDLGIASMSPIPFNNYGSIEIETGTLTSTVAFNSYGSITLSPGTTNRFSGGGSASGPFTVPSTALVEWTSGTFVLSSGAQLNGSGLYRITGGSFGWNTDISVENLELSATLVGSGVLTINNAMNWSGGAMGSGGGRTMIAPGATLTLNNAGTILLDARVLENAGTAVWTGGGGLQFGNTASITNRAGASFELRNATTFTVLGTGTRSFENAGTLRKTTSTGTVNFGPVVLNNYGSLEIETGILTGSAAINSYGSITLAPGTTNRFAGGGSASGTITAPAGALVEWTSGTFVLNPGAQLNGSGLYRIAGGSFGCNTDISVQNLELSATLVGSGVLTINNAMSWSAGAMGSGGGRTMIAPGATLTLNNAGTILLDARVLENAGTAVWTGGGGLQFGNTASITNRAGASFELRNATTFTVLGTGTRSFENAGMLRKTTSTGTVSFVAVPLNNYGTVDIRSGILNVSGGFTSSSSALLNCALGGTTAGTGYGQLQRSGTITLGGALSVDLLPGFTPATNDTFTVVTATVAVNGTFANFSYPSNRVTMVLSNAPSSVVLRVTEVFPVPAPMLLTPQLVASNALLTWTATSNVTYRLERNSDASLTNWTAIPGDVTTLSNTASKLDPLTTSNRLYRVRVIP